MANKWHVFMAFGEFKDPKTGENFIIIKRPAKGVLWRDTLAAIKRVIKPWGGEWYIAGDLTMSPDDPGSIWGTTVASHYLYKNGKLRRVS